MTGCHSGQPPRLHGVPGPIDFPASQFFTRIPGRCYQCYMAALIAVLALRVRSCIPSSPIIESLPEEVSPGRRLSTRQVSQLQAKSYGCCIPGGELQNQPNGPKYCRESLTQFQQKTNSKTLTLDALSQDAICGESQAGWWSRRSLKRGNQDFAGIPRIPILSIGPLSPHPQTGIHNLDLTHTQKRLVPMPQTSANPNPCSI